MTLKGGAMFTTQQAIDTYMFSQLVSGIVILIFLLLSFIAWIGGEDQ